MAIQATNPQPSTIATTTGSRTHYRTHFIKVEEQYFYFLSPAHTSWREFTACASHFWKQGTFYSVNTGHMHHLGTRGYKDVKSSWITSHLFSSLSACEALLQQQKPWVWTRVYQGWQGDNIKYKSEWLNKLGSWYSPSQSLFICRMSKERGEKEALETPKDLPSPHHLSMVSSGKTCCSSTTLHFQGHRWHWKVILGLLRPGELCWPLQMQERQAEGSQTCLSHPHSEAGPRTSSASWPGGISQ